MVQSLKPNKIPVTKRLYFINILNLSIELRKRIYFNLSFDPSMSF